MTTTTTMTTLMTMTMTMTMTTCYLTFTVDVGLKETPIMKGRDHQRAMEHAHQYKDGTAVTLRLVKPWCDSTKVEPRIIHGDSAFGSVECALALRKKGLHFMGAIKTSSREYPKKYFANKASKFATKEKRGGFIVLESLKKSLMVQKCQITQISISLSMLLLGLTKCRYLL